MQYAIKKFWTKYSFCTAITLRWFRSSIFLLLMFGRVNDCKFVRTEKRSSNYLNLVKHKKIIKCNEPISTFCFVFFISSVIFFESQKFCTFINFSCILFVRLFFLIIFTFILSFELFRIREICFLFSSFVFFFLNVKVIRKI